MKKEKLNDIAAEISAYLRRFEEDPSINRREIPPGGSAWRKTRFFQANAFVLGSRLFVRYVSYQGETSLTRDRAIAYLEALRGGFVGTHFQLAARKDEEATS